MIPYPQNKEKNIKSGGNLIRKNLVLIVQCHSIFFSVLGKSPNYVIFSSLKPKPGKKRKSCVYFLLITFGLSLAIYRKIHHKEFIHERNQEYYRLLLIFAK